jgi:hypothetical protein
MRALLVVVALLYGLEGMLRRPAFYLATHVSKEVR